ncbi:lipid A export permease/ATP-binding protein MsbA [Kerstersia similis]|uniref:lipid A export permease/ATP-binding protein MsbA n=1 Tax=Kerstersia similis TaxID=206505 RepID=UPI0039EF8DA0
MLWRRIYARVGQYWKGLALAIALMTGAALTQPALALIMKPLLDDGFSGGNPDYIWIFPSLVIAMIAVRGVLSFFSDYLLAWVANNVLLGLRRDMFERLLGLPDEAFRAGENGRLLNRFTIDAGNVTGYATSVMTVLIRESLIVLSMIAVLFYMSWQLSLIVLVMMPVAVQVSRVFIRRLRHINRDTVNMNAELTHVVSETIAGQRVVKLFDGYDRAREGFGYVNGRLRRFAMRSATADSAMTPVTQMCVAIAVAGAIAVALHQANQGTLTVGSFAAFITALAQIFDPVRRLTRVSGGMQKMLASAESVFQMIDEPVEQDKGKKVLEHAHGRVEFRNVSHRFSDTDRPTLQDISFVAEPGKTIALVGRSGSGKTTLVNMLPRFIEPSSGEVLLDGQEIHDLTLASLRRQISLVSQDVVLFDGSIAENVAYGAVAASSSDETVREALRSASLLDFVERLPNGIHTQVGVNAVRLSGGQRQRLAIARALIKDAPILILDEATSALDNEAERQVQASLERLMHNRTTLVIAHRLSTVQNADTILVLDEGRIVERGSHDELMRNPNGLYHALYQMQFRGS